MAIEYDDFVRLVERVQKLEDGLDAAIDSIARDMAKLQAEQKKATRPEMCEVMPRYDEYLAKAKQTTYYGVPITELEQDDLLACLAVAAEELAKGWRFTGLHNGN